jgi:L-ascorbate metabolism protein UlaG (beta-lactamase superfamily)
MPESASRPELSRRRLLSGAAVTTAAAMAVAATSRPGTAAAATTAAATPPKGPLLLTWLGHSCFRLEKDGFVAVVDPGIVAPASALDDADAVLITHQHADHFLPSLIAARLKTRPGLPVWTSKDVAALLDGSGAMVHVIGPGDADTGLDAQGLAGADGFLVQDRTPPFAPGTGSPFVRLPKGTPVNF